MVKERDLQLTDRDTRILDHIRVFRMTTKEVLQRLFFAGHDIEAVKSWQRRLQRAGLIGTAHFIKPRKYIYLTGDAMQKVYGEPAKAGGPLTAFPLARQYGILAFCCLLESVHRKINARQFCDRFPTLADNKLPKDFYYIDKDSDTHRLGLIYVDHGRNASRIYQRYLRIGGQRFKCSSWRQDVIERDRFIVAIVTAKPEKKKRIQEVFDGQRPRIPYRIEAVPELIHLI